MKKISVLSILVVLGLFTLSISAFAAKKAPCEGAMTTGTPDAVKETRTKEELRDIHGNNSGERQFDEMGSSRDSNDTWDDGGYLDGSSDNGNNTGNEAI